MNACKQNPFVVRAGSQVMAKKTLRHWKVREPFRVLWFDLFVIWQQVIIWHLAWMRKRQGRDLKRNIVGALNCHTYHTTEFESEGIRNTCSFLTYMSRLSIRIMMTCIFYLWTEIFFLCLNVKRVRYSARKLLSSWSFRKHKAECPWRSATAFI